MEIVFVGVCFLFFLALFFWLSDSQQSKKKEGGFVESTYIVKDADGQRHTVYADSLKFDLETVLFKKNGSFVAIFENAKFVKKVC